VPSCEVGKTCIVSFTHKTQRGQEATTTTTTTTNKRTMSLKTEAFVCLEKGGKLVKQEITLPPLKATQVR
jgi:hypothetical protein